MRANCTSEHSSTPLVVLAVFLMMCHDPLGSSSLSLSSSRHVAHVWFSLIFTYLPFYFNLSFPVFFHSSVLMHPDLHTDLDNLDSVENNLRHSAKEEPRRLRRHLLPSQVNEPNDTVSNDTVSNKLVDSQGPFSYVTPSSDQDIDDTTLGQAAHRSTTPRIRRLPQSGRCVCQSVVIVCRAPIEWGNPWKRATSISLVLVSETRTVLTIISCNHPS